MAIISHEQVPALDASYRTIRVLAAGPGGLTELVRGPKGDVLVRKVIPLELANVHAWMELTRIESPLLPQVQALYQRDDNLAVVLTYVDGLTLEELVTSTGPIEAPTAARYLGELCQAADVLHAHGIVHRDLSPGNIVVAGGSPRIIDLGNARVHEEGARKDTTTLGTYGFAAPEQFGFAQTDARSDVYSLGSLLGYMLTGLRPDDPGFDAALADAFRVPADLRLVVEKARAFEPSQRYQSARELAAACRWREVDSARLRAQAMSQTNATLVARPKGSSNQPLKLLGSWVFFLFWAFCFVSAGKDYWTGSGLELPTRLYYILSTSLGAVANVAMAIETQHALRLEGIYATAENVKKTLGRRLRTMVLTLLAVIILLAFISSLVS